MAVKFWEKALMLSGAEHVGEWIRDIVFRTDSGVAYGTIYNRVDTSEGIMFEASCAKTRIHFAVLNLASLIVDAKH